MFGDLLTVPENPFEVTHQLSVHQFMQGGQDLLSGDQTRHAGSTFLYFAHVLAPSHAL